jgi:glycosyltransferase involved in cell wall biosynthesis
MSCEFVGLMRVKNEEKFIEEVLEAQNFCDVILVLNNYSTDRTKEIAQSFKNVVVIDSPFPDEYTEGLDQEYLCERAREYDPQWICRMQGDEVLERDTYKKLRPYISDQNARCIEVHSLNYWNDTNTLRVDGWSGRGFRQSFWRFPKEKLTYDFMHCSLPQQLAGVPMIRPGIALWHYGFMEPSRRKFTTELQKRADRSGVVKYYDWALQGDPGGPDKSINITGEPFRLQSVDEFLKGKSYSRRARETQ